MKSYISGGIVPELQQNEKPDHRLHTVSAYLLLDIILLYTAFNTPKFLKY